MNEFEADYPSGAPADRERQPGSLTEAEQLARLERAARMAGLTTACDPDAHACEIESAGRVTPDDIARKVGV